MGEAITELPMEVLLLGLGIILLLFLIVVITLWIKLNKLRKNYKKMMNGEENADLEKILIRLQEKGNQQAEKTERVEQSIRELKERVGIMKSNIGVFRYNAFAESGSDLSFSVAILDDTRSGVVLTGIHSREHTYVYAKPIEQGQSQYTLSPEEKEAITRSVPKS